MADDKKKPKLDLKATTAEEFRAKINKAMGKNTLIKGSQIKRQEWPRATSGSVAIDVMLGGGWPLNQWNEIVGLESSGKTLLCLKTLAANQAKAKAEGREYRALWIAAEDFVVEYAEMVGVDIDGVDIVEDNVTENVLNIMDAATESQLYDFICLDSLPALVPSEEAEKSMEESSMAVNARLIGKFFRKSNKSKRRDLVEPEGERDVLLLIINQWREKIGVVYGDPRTTPGGKSKNYSFFIQVEVARDEWLVVNNPNPSNDYDKTIKVGQAIKVRSFKNKTAPSQRVVVIDFYFSDAAEGFEAGDFDTLKEIISLALSLGVITKETSMTYMYGGEKLSTSGRPGLEATLREDLTLQRQIEQDVYMLTTRNGAPE